MIYTALPSGDNFGWGICGDSLNKALRKITDVRTLGAETASNGTTVVGYPVLHTVRGPDFLPSNMNVWSSKRNVGLAFIEDIDLALRHKENAFRYYDHIICGSSWCAQQLRVLMGISTSVAIQGVDSELFYPIENKPKHPRFNIGSFGKFEYRKGQDVVIAAFGMLCRKYPEMHLLAGWGNLWPETMESMNQSVYIKYAQYASTPTNDSWKTRIESIMRWANIPRERYTLLDIMPHHEMPLVYHRCDLAVFPNRVEAGTNLPLMECIACGIPTMSSLLTGHSDIAHFLTDTINCITPEHLAEKIEEAMNATDSVPRVRDCFSQNFSWDKTAKSVLEAINNTELKHARL